MNIFRCLCCGGQIEIIEGTSVGECSSCGHQQVISDILEQRMADQFRRAEACFINGEFSLAEELYDQILDDYPDNAAANWGCCLCRYGICYTDDPVSGRRIPSCTRITGRSILDDPYYAKAVTFADENAEETIRSEAELISSIQKRLAESDVINQSCDIYICYRTGEHDTADEHAASEIQRYLENDRYSVFTSAGASDEARMFVALKTAKVMILIASEAGCAENLAVRSQWEKFMGFMGFDDSKKILVCYKNMNPDKELPYEFKGIEALDMEPFAFMALLQKNVARIMGRTQQAAPVMRESYSPSQAMKERIRIFLENGQRDEAVKYTKEHIKRFRDDAEMYWLSILFHYESEESGELPIKKMIRSCLEKYMKQNGSRGVLYNEELADKIASEAFLDRADKAIELASEPERSEYIRVKEEVYSGFKSAIMPTYYNNAYNLLQVRQYDSARAAFEALGDYRDSRALHDKAIGEKERSKAQELYRERNEKYNYAASIYQSCCRTPKPDITAVKYGMYQNWLDSAINTQTSAAAKCDDAAKRFKALGIFRNSQGMEQKCRASAEAFRLQAANLRETYYKRRNDTKRTMVLVDSGAVLMIVILMLLIRKIDMVVSLTLLTAVFPVMSCFLKTGAPEEGKGLHVFLTIIFFLSLLTGAAILEDWTIDSVLSIGLIADVVYIIAAVITRFLLRRPIAMYFAANDL